MSHCGQLPYLVGAASVDITPPLEVGLLMSSVEGRWAPFEGTRLPLMARALFLTHGDTQAALVSLDLLGLESTSVGGFDRFKERIVAAADFVVRADELLITSTHTHTAPESIGLTDLCETQAFQDWIEALARSIGQAIRRAARHAVPAQLALGMARAPELCLHRRIRTRRGILLSHPMPPADIILPGTGPVDDSVNVALFLGADARPVGIVVNATCHPVHEMCLPFISPDYPGELCNLLAGELGCEALFLNGAAGNINPPTVSDGPAAAQAHAARLHRAVLEAMQNTPATAPADARTARTRRGGPAGR
jgi:neutral ceramidase